MKSVGVVIVSVMVLCAGCSAIDGLWADIPPYLGSDSGESGEPDAADASFDTSTGEVGFDDGGGDADTSSGLAVPTNVSVTGRSDGVFVRWDAVVDAEGYEVRVDDGGWVPVGDTTEYLDEQAPPGALSGELFATASNATSGDFVALTAQSNVVAVSGEARVYRVRSVSRGRVSEASEPTMGSRAVGPIQYKWQRSESDGVDVFADIDGAVGLSYEDTSADPLGSKAQYRVAAFADGAPDEIVSFADVGWRLAAIKVAVGYGHSCAILSDGALKCWGSNEFGQLGYTTPGTLGDEFGEMPPPTVDVGGAPVVDVAVSLRSTCALTETGSVRCWGNNADGQLGRGNVLDVGLAQGDMPPGFVSLPVTAVSIHAGGYSASGVNGPLEEDRFCAVGANGEVLCWGNGTGAALGTGQPGNVGDEPGEIPPTQSLTGGAVDGLKIGAFSACYWRSGDVRCWGATNVTLLGEVIGDDPLELPPPSLPVQPTDGIIALDIGFLAACWLDSTATLKCWGFNNAGNLGAGFDENIDENNIPSRVPYDANAPGMVAVDVSMGLVHTCVLGQMGEVVCWGSGAVSNVNGDANLGDGPDEIPAPLPFGEPVHRLSKSSGTNGHECVILSSGRVSCWGAAAPERVTFGYGSDDVLVSPAQVGVRRVPLW